MAVKNILVVDDFPVMRKIIVNNLNEILKCKVTEAEDGNDALSKLKQDTFDLVITDWNMPNMSGLDMIKAMKSDPATSKLPILMVTAEAKKEQVVAAAKAGINGYILKPFTPAVLKEKLIKMNFDFDSI